MTPREEVLARLSSVFPSYRFKWTDSMGDFAGRENAIDVFDVPPHEQHNFLRNSQKLREDLAMTLKARPIFIFRSI